MTLLLSWFALPLLLAPLVASSRRLNGSAGQLLLAGFGLAAFHQGAGTLDLLDLRLIGAQSSHDASFIGITAGIMLTGGCLFPEPANWRKAILGLPLAGALIWVAFPLFLPMVIGAAIGALPVLLGRALPAVAAPVEANRRTLTWSLDRTTAAGLLLPVLAVAVHYLAGIGGGEGIARWQPVISALLVVVALAVAARRGWEGAALALLLLAATRSGATALAGAVALGFIPLVARALGGARSWRIVTGVLAALVVSVLMRDEVLLAVLLAFGLAILANRLVAPVPAGVHL